MKVKLNTTMCNVQWANSHIAGLVKLCQRIMPTKSIACCTKANMARSYALNYNRYEYIKYCRY